MFIAHLSQTADDFPALQAAFAESNPGYRVVWHPRLTFHPESDETHLLFVHEGRARGRLDQTDSDLAVGDVVLVRPGQVLETDGPLGVVGFVTPGPAPDELPGFLRPDHDPLVCDTPGGCAEEERAYRRVLLTWEGKNGPYRWRAINCHRVRMWDSFSHYHPRDGGFDELYLVQDVGQEGRLYTSERVARIEAADGIDATEAGGLVREHPLTRGDLVWLPRGTMHRAVGGVLAHVITVPGFVPGREIGLDHHLRAIAERTGAPIPYRRESSDRPVIK